MYVALRIGLWLNGTKKKAYTITVIVAGKHGLQPSYKNKHSPRKGKQ